MWLLDKLTALYRPKPCDHLWRPCVARLLAWREAKPARICGLCNTWEPLTEEQFFAQFGENFFSASQRAAKGGHKNA